MTPVDLGAATTAPLQFGVAPFVPVLAVAALLVLSRLRGATGGGIGSNPLALSLGSAGGLAGLLAAYAVRTVVGVALVGLTMLAVVSYLLAAGSGYGPMHVVGVVLDPAFLGRTVPYVGLFVLMWVAQAVRGRIDLGLG